MAGMDSRDSETRASVVLYSGKSTMASVVAEEPCIYNAPASPVTGLIAQEQFSRMVKRQVSTDLESPNRKDNSGFL